MPKMTRTASRLNAAALFAALAIPASGQGADLTIFVPTRIEYQSVGGRGEAYYGYDGRLWERWETDFPQAERNFAKRLNELTAVVASRQPARRKLTHPALGDSPLIFMSDVGYMRLSAAEMEALGNYLENGGLLWVDDFWGTAAWQHWESEIGRVLPPSQYPIRDVPLDHPVFRTLTHVEKVPQINAIQFWYGSGGRPTSERGRDSAVPHFRAISDEHGRFLVVMTHNTDVADAWEREGDDPRFFRQFSPDGYGLGINVLLYAMSR